MLLSQNTFYYGNFQWCMDQQLTLTEEIEINDEIDTQLFEEILLIVQNTHILSHCVLKNPLGIFIF